MDIHQIIASAKYLHYIGSGADADAWRYIDQDNHVRILRLSSKKPINSIVTPELINKYRENSPLFIRFYGSFIETKSIPKQLLIPFGSLIENETVYIDILEDAGIDIESLINDDDDDQVSSYDQKCMLFHFLYGIYIARSISGSFSHNDVHGRNLTISRQPVNESRYVIDGQEFVTSSTFQLHLIDYDRATIPGHEKSLDVSTGIDIIDYEIDYENIYDLQKQLGYDLFDMNSPFHKMTWADDVDTIKSELLNNPVFDELRKKKRGKLTETCVQCFATAHYKTRTNNLHFCGAQCNSQYHL